mgnify:CR=1 FL=1
MCTRFLELKYIKAFCRFVIQEWKAYIQYCVHTPMGKVGMFLMTFEVCRMSPPHTVFTQQQIGQFKYSISYY